jgi:hypothetical protein
MLVNGTNQGREVRPIEPRRGNDRIFGKGNGGFGGWSKAKAALDDRICDAREYEAKGAPKTPTDDVHSMAAWTVHDIRRSVATHMAELGVLPHVIEAVMNHVSGHKAGVAGTYNHARYERETTAALLCWADHLRTLIESGDQKVVSFHIRAAAT